MYVFIVYCRGRIYEEIIGFFFRVWIIDWRRRVLEEGRKVRVWEERRVEFVFDIG